MRRLRNSSELGESKRLPSFEQPQQIQLLLVKQIHVHSSAATGIGAVSCRFNPRINDPVAVEVRVKGGYRRKASLGFDHSSNILAFLPTESLASMIVTRSANKPTLRDCRETVMLAKPDFNDSLSATKVVEVEPVSITD